MTDPERPLRIDGKPLKWIRTLYSLSVLFSVILSKSGSPFIYPTNLKSKCAYQMIFLRIMSEKTLYAISKIRAINSSIDDYCLDLHRYP